jgi:hypothetical protein
MEAAAKFQIDDMKARSTAGAMVHDLTGCPLDRTMMLADAPMHINIRSIRSMIGHGE